MDFRLTRLILIDSYCRNRIAELDISGHITINGENGAGKTTLLRLLPMFLGESPSKIIRGDAVMEKFSRYYFPSTASYVIFEYQRRNQKALAVIHPDGQNDGVVYRFIDSEHKPELFKDGNSLVQTGSPCLSLWHLVEKYRAGIVQERWIGDSESCVSWIMASTKCG